MSGKPSETPSINNFAQADSLVPAGVQGLDRYAYVNNSPVVYVDPSGHLACTDDGYCGYSDYESTQGLIIFAQDDEEVWTDDEKAIIKQGA